MEVQLRSERLEIIAMSLPPSKILLVEDDAEMPEVLAALLEQDGITLFAVGNVTEAWAQLQAEAFDLVLLDLGLPGADGFELLRRINESPVLQGLPAGTEIMRTYWYDGAFNRGVVGRGGLGGCGWRAACSTQRVLGRRPWQRPWIGGLSAPRIRTARYPAKSRVGVQGPRTESEYVLGPFLAVAALLASSARTQRGEPEESPEQ